MSSSCVGLEDLGSLELIKKKHNLKKKKKKKLRNWRKYENLVLSQWKIHVSVKRVRHKKFTMS